ncbi:MAG: T9SS type A sorting domain-containing protein [Phycisphaerae bacterium]|nr:T9SS type A sorting domain-containing protein [Saprospiraceae bacterium]
MKNILALILFSLAFGQMSAQCLLVNNCPGTTPICDYTANNAVLWNEAYWFDPANATQDLSDALTESNISVRDTCAGANVTLRYLLFLDLDKNGSWETVVKSWEPPAPGTVNFNNWNNPNYDGGDVRVFDERPVAANEKYQFAIETNTNGDITEGYLRWNTLAAPGTFKNPELPYATHKIKWLADDNFGNTAVCETSLVVKDCKKPTVVCLNGLSVNIMPTGEITLWGTDFLQYVEDNATPTFLLPLSIRKSGTGTGFPLNGNGDPIQSVTFSCDELGFQEVELWTRDMAGNADYCETYVFVQDNIGNCFGGGGNNNIPTVVCKNGLAVNILSTSQVELSTADFLHYAEDDNTPANLLEFSIRKCGLGIGFPEDGNGDPISNLTFHCNDGLGTQCLELWVRDLDGNADFCETYVLIQDNLGNCGGGNPGAPTVVCLNGLSVNIMPTGLIELWATDFLQYAQDDNTPSNSLDFGIRKSGTGTGFPANGNGPIQNIIFDCTEIGTQAVELWARDLDGKADYCETYVIVQDNAGNCNGSGVEITACAIITCNGSPLSGAGVIVNQAYVGDMGAVDGNGCAWFPSPAPIGGNLVIAPTKSNFPLNGVTVLDLIKIKRWILGLQTDLSPYAMIAADANKSGTITGFDIIELRKLILGVTDVFPNNNSSWRFIDANFNFPNPQNPFQSAFPESISINNAQQPAYQVAFKAIKIGDLDCDAWPGLQAPSHERGLPQHKLTLPDATLLQGETTEIALQMSEAGDWAGLQIGLQFDPEKVEIVEVLTGDLPSLDADNYYQPKPGVFNFVWAADQAQTLVPGQDLLILRIRALESFKVSEVFKASTNFENLGSLGDEPQTLTLDFRQNEAPVSLQETTILIPQPNPTNAGATIPVRLGQAERVRVEIADLSGKTLWVNDLDLSAGSHLLDIAPQAIKQAGVYVWRVQTGSKSASGKLVKI